MQYQPYGQPACWVQTRWQLGPELEPSSMQSSPATHRDLSHAGGFDDEEQPSAEIRRERQRLRRDMSLGHAVRARRSLRPAERAARAPAPVPTRIGVARGEAVACEPYVRETGHRGVIRAYNLCRSHRAEELLWPHDLPDGKRHAHPLGRGDSWVCRGSKWLPRPPSVAPRARIVMGALVR